jgi:hypothetical protein
VNGTAEAATEAKIIIANGQPSRMLFPSGSAGRCAMTQAGGGGGGGSSSSSSNSIVVMYRSSGS